MLVMRCENRRREKCSKAAHKTDSHARAANPKQPRAQIVGAVCGCRRECVYTSVSCWPMCNVRTDGWLQLWGFPLPRMQSALEDVLAVKGCKDQSLHHGMLADGLRACLIAITHNHTHACFCLLLLYDERTLLSCPLLIFTPNEPSLFCATPCWNTMMQLNAKCEIP